MSSWLKLSTLHAKIENVRIEHTLSSDMGVKVAHGEFVVVSLSVTNHSDSPQSFDHMGDATGLVLTNGKTYTENFEVGNGIDQNSYVWNSQPDTTVTHDLIFEVPAHARVSFAKLAVLNFGDDMSSWSQGDEIGSMDLGSLA